MAQLDRLIRDARNAMKTRGHTPMPAERWFDSAYQRSGARIQCANCDMETDVICKPRPNDTHISGKAVALNCNVASNPGIPEKEFGLNAVEEKIAMYAVIGC